MTDVQWEARGFGRPQCAMLTFVDVARPAPRRPPPTEYHLAYVPVLVRRPRSPRRRSSLVIESSHAEMVRAALRRSRSVKVSRRSALVEELLAGGRTSRASGSPR